MRSSQFVLADRDKVPVSPESLQFAQKLYAAESIDDVLRTVPSAATVSLLSMPALLTRFYDPYEVSSRVQIFLNHQNLWAVDKTFCKISGDEIETHEQNRI